MFQTFDVSTRPGDGPPRLAALRAALAAEQLDGFLVPRADAHQGEYVAPHDERLSWLTGFTGSAGFCAVLPHVAGVFIDGRYTVQVRSQVDLAHFTPVSWPGTSLSDWLDEQLPRGGVIGFDPWLHSVDEIERAHKKGEKQGITFRPVRNFVDQIWADQPAPPMGLFSVHPDDRAGEPASSKSERLGKSLSAAGQTCAVLTLPDSIAWLLNIRGTDIQRNPVPHGFAVLHADGQVDLYCAPEKLTDAVRAHLGNGVALHPVEAFGPGLAGLTGRVRLDPASAPVWVVEQLTGAEVVHGKDPCLLPKACKNPAEIAGMEAAHLRDGAAIARLLAWIDAEAPKGTLTEIDVVKRLEAERAKDPDLRDISFDTIAGSGPNGAIVHYRVTTDTNRTITPGDILLVDSGGQYLDGTTDITRTLATGPVSDAVRAAFTRVLKGMIGISLLRWPAGLAGRDLDAVARLSLWQAGLDYDHGTGHGVGVYLSVHEGPQRLSRVGDVPFEPGMCLSNEPGYYREGAFGIRIENLLYVTQAPDLPGGDAHRKMLRFTTLTWAPIDRRLIDTALLTAPERLWLDAYHAEVRAKIGPLVEGATSEWLDKATQPL